MATREQIEQALAVYEQRGDMNTARMLKATLAAMDQPPPPPEPPGVATQIAGGLKEGGEKILKARQAITGEVAGAVETAGTLATGMTTGLGGGFGGAIYETARQILSGEFNPNDTSSVDEFAARAAAQGTYEPRSQAGRRNVQAFGEFIEPAVPYLNALGPLGAEANALAQAGRNAAQAIRAAAEASGVPAAAARTATAAGKAVEGAARSGAAAVREGAGKTADAARDLAGRAGDLISPTPAPAGAAGPRSAGAAEVPVSDLRVAKAGELPVPIKYTKAQRTRTFEDQKLERETLAKDVDIGDPIRQRYAEQHEAITLNVDRLIESSGATKTDSLRGIGEAIVRPLVGKLEARKAKVRVKYAAAKKAGELEAPVDLKGMTNYLNENRSLSSSVLEDVRREAVRIGAATKDADGNLVPKAVKLEQGEQLRQFIGEATGSDRKEIRQATRLKKAYDADTASAGGKLYQEARGEHARLVRDFESASAVSRLLKNKRGTGDRAVAFEDVLNRTVLDDGTSLDQLKSVTRILQQAGPEGRQALKELRGGTLEWIKSEATKSVAANQAVSGARTVSPTGLHRAINKLDKSGKLDYLFGKKNAETLRILDEVAQDVLTAPPGTVNTSGTASAIAGLIDISLAAGTGIPVPVATGLKVLSKQVRNAKLRAKVQEHLQ